MGKLISFISLLLSIVILLPLAFYAPTMAKIVIVVILIASVTGGIMISNRDNNKY